MIHPTFVKPSSKCVMTSAYSDISSARPSNVPIFRSTYRLRLRMGLLFDSILYTGMSGY